MFKGNPAVIRCQLTLWEKHGLRRYYCNDWSRYLSPEDVYRYTREYDVDPTDRGHGIKVFFEEDGTLVISNCHDPVTGMLLEERMKGWYRWARDQYEMSNSNYPNVLDLIRPHMTEFRPGSTTAR